MSKFRRVGDSTAAEAEPATKRQVRVERQTARLRRFPSGGSRIGAVSWIVTSALVLLALLIIGAAVFAALDDVDGPSTKEIAVHVVGAVAGLGLQRVAGRASLPVRILASLAIVAILGVLLWFFWWA